MTFNTKDISTEIYRVYEYPDGGSVRIQGPSKLYLKGGSDIMGALGPAHRILDTGGISHYVPAGWNHLYWKVKDQQPPFSF